MAEQRTFVITITTAGTELAGPATTPGDYLMQAYKGNTGDYVYVGNNGSNVVSSATGWSIKKDGSPLVMFCNSLADLMFDVDTSGDKIIAVRL